MPTIKQKKALAKIVENRGNMSKSMREAGYSPKTAKNPRNLTRSKGFSELCQQYGLTQNLVIKSLVADIKAKPGGRKQELELASKILGMFDEKPQQGPTTELRQIYMFDVMPGPKRKPGEVFGYR